MTDQPAAADPQYPTPDQYKAAAAGQQVPYAQAAASAVGQALDTDTSQGTDAGTTIDQIRQQVTREVLLPMETKIQAMMDAAQAQQAQLKAQIDQLQSQLTATRAQVGPPAATLYAKALGQRVASIAAANPHLGAGHFAGVVDAAGQLAAAADDVAKGAADPDVLTRLAAPVVRFFTSHRGRHLEGAGTVVDEAGHLADETDKLKAAA